MASNGAKHVEPHYELPSQKALDEAGELEIKDENDKPLKFKTLYTGKPETSRQLIVFIRHFFCGHCEEYVRALTRELPVSTLSASNITLTLIGCGEASCISDYKKRTDCEYDIFCDPSRALYRALSMEANLKGGKKPEYMTVSPLSSAWSSFLTALTAGRTMMQGGVFYQNGGEWVFEGGNVTWCRRMRTTMDHAEVKEVKAVLGI